MGTPKLVAFAFILIGFMVSGAMCVDDYPVSPNAEYVSLGDSATHGNRFDQSYPWFLQEMLYPEIPFDVNNYSLNKVDNRGRSGDKACGNTRLEDLLNQGTFPEAETVLYMLGGNDLIIDRFCNRFQAPLPEEEVRRASQEVAACIRSSVERLRLPPYGLEVIVGRYFKAQAYAGPEPPAAAACIGIIDTDVEKYVNDALEIFHEEVNAALAGLGLEIVPAADYSLGSDGYNNDGMHPNDIGSRVVAEQWCLAITEGDPEQCSLP